MVYIIIKIYIHIYYEIYIYTHTFDIHDTPFPRIRYICWVQQKTPDSSLTSCGTLHGPGEGAFLVKIRGVERLIGVFFLQSSTN